MKSILRLILAGIIMSVFLSLTGCIYANVRLPLDTDVSVTELGSKEGEASIQSVLGLIAWGDASTQAAARDGSIEVIRHLDQEQLVVLFGLYTKMTTIAYGD